VAMHLPPTFATLDHRDVAYTTDAQGSVSLLAQPAHLDVVFSTDANGFVGLMNTMRSLAWNLKDPTKCSLHVIVPKEDLEKAEELLQCFRKSLPGLAAQSKIPAVKLHQIKPQLINMSIANAQVASEHWFRPPAFTRIYIPDYLPNASRALWLDTDTIVQTDVTVLSSFPMNHSLAAVLENPGLAQTLESSLPPAYKQYAGKIGKNAANWFNSGVLLIDVQKFMQEGRSARLTKWFSILNGVQGDELMLNFDYQSDFDMLDSRWNFGCLTAPFTVNKTEIPHAFVLHWSCSSKKPWIEDKRDIRGWNDKFWDVWSPKGKCGDW